jgi:hypothetical protein
MADGGSLQFEFATGVVQRLTLNLISPIQQEEAQFPLPGEENEGGCEVDTPKKRKAGAQSGFRGIDNGSGLAGRGSNETLRDQILFFEKCIVDRMTAQLWQYECRQISSLSIRYLLVC